MNAWKEYEGMLISRKDMSPPKYATAVAPSKIVKEPSSDKFGRNLDENELKALNGEQKQTLIQLRISAENKT